jgi:hypothetical protein
MSGIRIDGESVSAWLMGQTAREEYKKEIKDMQRNIYRGRSKRNWSSCRGRSGKVKIYTKEEIMAETGIWQLVDVKDPKQLIVAAWCSGKYLTVSETVALIKKETGSEVKPSRVTVHIMSLFRGAPAKRFLQIEKRSTKVLAYRFWPEVLQWINFKDLCLLSYKKKESKELFQKILKKKILAIEEYLDFKAEHYGESVSEVLKNWASSERACELSDEASKRASSDVEIYIENSTINVYLK